MHHRALLAVILVTLALAGPVPAVEAQAPAAPVTYVAVSGTGGDWVTMDKSYFWGLGDGAVTVTGSVSDRVTVHTSGGTTGVAFDLVFAAAPGETLVAGEYNDAQRAPFREAGHPGLDVDGNSHGCNTVAGSFTVKDMAPDLSRLWIVFQQHCDGGRSAAFGEIKLNMPADESGLESAPSGIQWPALAARYSSTVPVRLHNEGDSPITIESASVSGSGAFSIVQNACSNLTPGAFCKVVVKFAPSLTGDYAGELTITDTGGSHVVPLTGSAYAAPVSGHIASDKGGYSYGLTAQVTATISGSYLDPTVSIYKKVAGSSRELVARQGVDAKGRVVVSIPMKERTRFTMEWSDGASHGTDSIERRVRAVKVTIAHPAGEYEYGDRALLVVKLGGAPHPRVQIYRQVGEGPSVLIARRTVDSSGRAELFVRARTNATFTVTWTDDDGVVAATDISIVNVRAGVRVTPTRYVRRVAGYHVYRPGTRMVVRGVVSPNKARECLVFTVEFYDRYWRRLGRTGCVRLSSRSQAAAYLNYNKALLGRRLRFHAGFPADKLNLGNRSDWVYARYAR